MRWWIKLIAALIVIALMLWLGWNLLGGVWKVLSNAEFVSEPDPMFAQEAETPTRPPELDAEMQAPNHLTLDDYSMPEGAPVDKTADQLIREAQDRTNS